MTALKLISAAILFFAVLAGLMCLLLLAAWPVACLVHWLFFPSSSRASQAALAPSRRTKPRGLSIR